MTKSREGWRILIHGIMDGDLVVQMVMNLDTAITVISSC